MAAENITAAWTSIPNILKAAKRILKTAILPTAKHTKYHGYGMGKQPCAKPEQ